MSGFHVLDVPEFLPIIAAARRNPRCRVHDPVAGYWFVEFFGEIEIARAETGLGPAVWFGCLTAGLEGAITTFDEHVLRLAPTNKPVFRARDERQVV